MPADYASTARALALPVDSGSDEELTPTHTRHADSAWHRRSASLTHSSHTHNLPPNASLQQKALHHAAGWIRQGRSLWNRLSLIQKILLVIAGVVANTLLILFLAFNEKIFHWMEPYAEWWSQQRGGWLLLWLATFLVSFPPCIGYSTLVTTAGFVYGMNGWFIIATATLCGSTTAFLASRTLLSAWVQRLLAHDTRFAALALTLKHDGLKLLVMIRLCPLPYSLSNGACATFPSVTPAAFALATALVSPKLLIHIFIGSRLRAIAGGDGEMDAKTKALNWASVAFGMLVGTATGLLIYRQTKLRASELEIQEAEEGAARDAGRPGSGYSDEPGRGLRERPSDISLRDQGLDDPFGEEVDDDGYRDWDSEEGDLAAAEGDAEAKKARQLGG